MVLIRNQEVLEILRNLSSPAPALPKLTEARSLRDPTAFLLRRRGLLTSHRLNFRSYLTSTASVASTAKIMPKPTRSTGIIGRPAAPLNRREEHRQAFQERNIAKSRNEWLYPYDPLQVALT